MKRLILFRFHDHLLPCRNRLRILKRHNPRTPIHGLYGGPAKRAGYFARKLAPWLDGFYHIPVESSYWKRTHGDLAIRLWHRDVGHALDFAALHLLEWDLLLAESLDEIYRQVPVGAVALSAPTPLRQIQNAWWWFTGANPEVARFRREWNNLIRHARDQYGFTGEPLACEFPGALLSREFLDRYAAAEIPEWCHDELRVPLFAAVSTCRFAIPVFPRPVLPTRRPTASIATPMSCP